MKRFLPLALISLFFVSIAPAYAFSDIDADTPNMEAIMTLSTLGITRGYDDNSFRPYANINRAEFLKMVLQSKEIAPTEEYKDCFDDVRDKWYATFICYAKDQKWVSGMTPTSFYPERSITRAEALKIILNVYSYQIPVTMGTTSSFIDVEPASWYAGYIHVAMRRNISDLTGVHFFPNNMITRGAASELLYRTLMIDYTKSPVYDRDTALAFLSEELGVEPNVDDDSEYPMDMSLYFQIWNELRYYHPDSEKISDDDMYYGSIKGLAEAFKDPYTYFLSPSETDAFLDELDGRFVGIGISFEEDPTGIKVLRVFEDSPASTAGLVSGDIIIAIDGKAMEGVRAEQVSSYMKGDEGTSVELELVRKSGEVETLSLTRAKVTVPSVAYESIDTTIGKIVINQFAEDTGEAMLEALDRFEAENKTKLILDLRDNGGGYLDSAVEIGSFFLPTNTTLFFSEDYPYPKKTKFTALPGKKLSSDIKVVVLVNENTASAAEVLAASLHDNDRATLIGNYTFGKGVAQQLFSYLDNSMLRITTSKWYTPKDINLGVERDGHKGLIPDVIIIPESNHDVVMEEAIKMLGK